MSTCLDTHFEYAEVLRFDDVDLSREEKGKRLPPAARIGSFYSLVEQAAVHATGVAGGSIAGDGGA